MFLEYAMQKPNESVNDYLLSTELNSTNSIVYQHNYAFNSSVRATVNVSAGGGAAGAETKPAAYATVKAGLAFSAAGSSLVVNAGTPVAIANSAMPSSQPNLQIGGFNGNGLVGAALIKKIMMLPRKMSDAELQTLTT
jgi:hypothetical protein